MTGYEALRQGAAIIDLSARGRIRATGEDRLRLLHAMTTNHVQEMRAGTSLYAFFLNAQGRILADADIWCGAEAALVDVEPETREKVFQHIDRYIIADDVTLEDVTETTAEIGVEGPGAEALRREGIAIGNTVTGQPGFRLIVPVDEKEALLAELRAAGAVEASAEEARAVRLENGRPRYGEDMTEANLAQETGQMRALHFNKGCYLGQEIVERVRSRGHVNRTLRALRIEGTDVPAAGTKVMSADKEAGEITSAAYSPGEGCVRALAYLRTVENLSVAGAAAQAVQG
ncbi:MAG: folate-binding protein YgfZ [Candidatus Solibacter usitatus]|nr:folate-binding protein YgfZ [Candidatus Solibacter usitatus]